MSEDLTRSTIVRDGLPDGEAVACVAASTQPRRDDEDRRRS